MGTSNPNSGNTTFAAHASLVRVLFAIIVVLVGKILYDSGYRAGLEASRPVPSNQHALDVNRASVLELRTLPGVGESLAERVVSHRQRNGHFATIDELRQVPGFGPQTFQRLRPLLFVDTNEPASVTSAKPAQSPAPVATWSLDPNVADLAELQRLPGIGPKLSQRIVDERNRKPFQSAEELRRVSGIGVKTLEKLRPHLRFSAAKSLAVEASDGHRAESD